MSDIHRSDLGRARSAQIRSEADRERLAWLLAFLDDESPRVWSEVRRELGRAGRIVEPALEGLARSSDARRRARARRILADRARDRAARRLTAFALGPDVELERGLWLLSRLERPGFDARPYVKALDAMGREVQARAARESSPLACSRAVCAYLGGELGFAGSASDYSHPDNVFLHRVVERRAGMPLTLAALYAFVARRAGIKAALVPLPGHVIVRLYAGADSVLVDPFHRGEVRTESECLQYLAQHGLSFQPAWFKDAHDGSMFARHVANLRASWRARGLAREVGLLDGVLAACSRNPEIPIPERQVR